MLRISLNLFYVQTKSRRVNVKPNDASQFAP